MRVLAAVPLAALAALALALLLAGDVQEKGEIATIETPRDLPAPSVAEASAAPVLPRTKAKVPGVVVRGRCVDEHGGAIERAEIAISPADLRTWTGRDGTFSLEVAAPWTLTAQKSGFASVACAPKRAGDGDLGDLRLAFSGM